MRPAPLLCTLLGGDQAVSRQRSAARDARGDAGRGSCSLRTLVLSRAARALVLHVLPPACRTAGRAGEGATSPAAPLHSSRLLAPPPPPPPPRHAALGQRAARLGRCPRLQRRPAAPPTSAPRLLPPRTLPAAPHSQLAPRRLPHGHSGGRCWSAGLATLVLLPWLVRHGAVGTLQQGQRAAVPRRSGGWAAGEHAGCPLACPYAHGSFPAPHCPPHRPAGLLLLTLLCGFSIYTSYLLAALHEAPNGERLNTYREMGEALLGAQWLRVSGGCMAWVAALLLRTGCERCEARRGPGTHSPLLHPSCMPSALAPAPPDLAPASPPAPRAAACRAERQDLGGGSAVHTDDRPLVRLSCTKWRCCSAVE